MYVCLCHGVTDRTIRAEIARGACTPEDVAACTGAGTKCGRCRTEVEALIADEARRHGLVQVGRRGRGEQTAA